MSIMKNLQASNRKQELNDKRFQQKRYLHRSIKCCQDRMLNFLLDLVSISSESCNEAKVIERTRKEMERTGFDSVRIDSMGNIIGKIGNGKRVIAMDAHLDTVGTGRKEDWKTDPLKGVVKNNRVYGLGAVDQKAGMASMVYGVQLMKENNLLTDFTLYIVGSVQEEDCDGLCWRYIMEKEKLNPECVVITEPTNLKINIGHRGRMEIEITVRGRSSHGSMPELGDNAIYKMGRIIREIEILNENLKTDPFLGKGTVTISHIDSKSPSLCSVPYECSIYLDRRLTLGENKESALKEIKEAVAKAGIEADIKIPEYSKPSYRNNIHSTECYFPTWKLPESHSLLSAAKDTCKVIFSGEAEIGRWTFSTNGVATMGVFNIPTIGFGPGDEKYAHSPNEFVPVDDLIYAAQWYALFPMIYTEIMEDN